MAQYENNNSEIYLHMAPMDAVIFKRYLETAKIYFEYGCGGSTLEAFIRPNIQKIYSVENDQKMFNKIKQKIHTWCPNTQRVQLWYHNLPVKSQQATVIQSAGYSNYLPLLGYELASDIDILLINGKYKLACALKAFEYLRDDAIIVFNDFLNKRKYWIINKFYDIVETTHDNKMAIFKKKPNTTVPSAKLIARVEKSKY